MWNHQGKDWENNQEDRRMKKALIVTTVSGFLPQFEMNNVRILQQLGYEVHYAANYKMPAYGEDNRRLKGTEIKRHQIDFVRSPYEIKANIKAYQQLKALEENIHFDLIHCHTPMGGMLARLCSKKYRKDGTKVIYTAHGFHFYEGASLKNWLLYYPVEKLCSRWTDVLITINREDYDLAKKKMHTKTVEYVRGVGIDTEKFGKGKKEENRECIRAELGIPKEAVLLLSVGELNKNKNHETVIRAVAKLPEIKEDKVYYAIAGKGELEEWLRKLIRNLGLESQVFLLGFREDMAVLYHAADIFLFPSKREGLSVALMEAMASGLPCIASKIRGNIDLLEDGKGGYLCQEDDIKGFAQKIEVLVKNMKVKEKFGYYNQEKIKKFNLYAVNEKMRKIYEIQGEWSLG